MGSEEEAGRQGMGASLRDRAGHEPSPDGLGHAVAIPSAEDDRPHWDYDEGECWNCGGDGFVYGCSWDWQCDTWDGDSCLCTRVCDICHPPKPNPAMQAVLAQGIEAGTGETREAGLDPKDESPAANGGAPNLDGNPTTEGGEA